MRFVVVLLLAIAQLSLGAPASPDQALAGPCPYDDCIDLINVSACYNGAVSRKDKKGLFECVPEGGQELVSGPPSPNQAAILLTDGPRSATAGVATKVSSILLRLLPICALHPRLRPRQPRRRRRPRLPLRPPLESRPRYLALLCTTQAPWAATKRETSFVLMEQRHCIINLTSQIVINVGAGLL